MSGPSSLSHEIASALRSDILRRQYRAGERLPSERELALRFATSRGAVREALSQLEQCGLIDIQPGGVRVRPLEEASLVILGPLLALDSTPRRELVDQFLEMFGILMDLTVRRAIALATVEQMNHLQNLLVRLSASSGDFAEMEPVWREMLDYLAGISDHLVVRLIGNDLKAQFVGQMMELGLRPKLRSATGTELVRNLKQAFASKDGDLAANAFHKHFDALRAAVMEVLPEADQRPLPRLKQA